MHTSLLTYKPLSLNGVIIVNEIYAFFKTVEICKYNIE